MKIEKIYHNNRYTLSNDNLNVGDKVYPIARGRCLDDGTWILTDFDFRDFTSGFPDDPHIIENLKHSDYKPYEVKTDKGYSPIECYFKIIKMEKQTKIKDTVLDPIFKWNEIK